MPTFCCGVQDIHGLVHPAPLVPYAGKELVECLPEAERVVADRYFRDDLQPALFDVDHRPYAFCVKVSVATTIDHAKGGQFVTHVKAQPGNPYDGHTLASVILDMEALTGNTIARILADKGYRGHYAPSDHKFRVFIFGQKREVTPKINRELRRRAAVEPVSASSRPSTAWTAIISGSPRGTLPTPSSPLLATTSAASSASSAFCWAKSSRLSLPHFRPLQPEAGVLHGRRI